MTIQPNNQAPKFQDPAESPARTDDPRKQDASKDHSFKDTVKEKAAAVKDNLSKDRDTRTDESRADESRTDTSRTDASRTDGTDGRHGRSDADSTADYSTADLRKSPEAAAANKSTDARTTEASDARRTEASDAKRAEASDARRTEASDAKTAPQNQAPVAARTRLFEDHDVTRFREQWRELQAGFVDEPRGAVREADTLVSQMMDTLTTQLTEQKRALQGDSEATDTEQLRIALQRYRSLFDQMLQV